MLFAIYAIMMALVEIDRSHDPLGTPVSITRPDTYAPLQPSIATPTEDWEDMAVMRAQTQQVLLRPTLDRQMPIGLAIGPGLAAAARPAGRASPPVVLYPKGQHEGHFAEKRSGRGRPIERSGTREQARTRPYHSMRRSHMHNF